MTRHKLSVTTTALAVLLLAAAPTSALYIQTPLVLEAAQTEAQVGDTVDFIVRPANETAAARYAGATVRVLYSYDANENANGTDPDGSVDSSSIQERVLVEALPLDDAATATFAFTAPSEVDDHNVDLYIEDAAGERVAFAFLPVGDAPPTMRILAASGPGGEEVQESAGQAEQDAIATPGFGLLAVAGALAALAAAMRRRA